MTTHGLTVRQKISFVRDRKQKVITDTPRAISPIPRERVPRIARLMALAIHLEGLVTSGEVRDYAEIARLGHVTRARLTQIIGLLNLAPDIQEEILHLPLTTSGRDPITERAVRPIAAELEWREQRRMWADLKPG